MAFTQHPDVGTAIIDSRGKNIGRVIGYSLNTDKTEYDQVRFAFRDASNASAKEHVARLPYTLFMQSGWRVHEAPAMSREERVAAALRKYGICATCLVPYTFDDAEPYAHCACGATEWGNDRPDYRVVPVKPAT